MKRTFQKIIAMGLALLMLIGCMAGCGSTSGTETTTEANNQTTTEGSNQTTTEAGGTSELAGQTAAIILPNLRSEFMTNLANNVSTALEELGMSVEVASSDNDPAKQIELLENFTNKGTDIIIIMPQGASAGEIGSTLKRLSDSGVRIISFGNKVDVGCCEAQILTNFVELGHDTARAAAEWIDATFPDAEDGSIEVAIMTTNSSVESKGQSDALWAVEEYTSKAKVVVSYDRSFTDPITKIQEYTDMMLITNPDVKVVLAYDAEGAMAVNEVIMRTPQIDKAKFGIFTSGYTLEVGERLKASVQNESVLRATNTYSSEDKTNYGAIIQAVKGELPLNEDDIYYLITFPISPENLSEYLY